MKAQKSAGARKGNLRPKQERRDDDIIHTNDSSIVSKRCVSKLYLSDEPDFYEPFAPTYVRRNPLVNRGYRMRIHAIEQVVHRFLSQDDGKSKVVVNLGCGYDPLPFQFWHRHASLAKNATFVDVDYPQLIERKRSRMLTNNLLRDSLLKTKLRPSEQPVYLRSDQYMAIGCDLRNLELLERVLRAELNMPGSAILFVAEVSVTYMPLADADVLIRWANTISNARFCVLEQFLPEGPGHPFASTMMGHFDKLQASINSVKKYQSLAQQSSRYLDAGWPSLELARSLWELWSDDTFTPPDLRKQVDAIEPFDEWEEFALYGGHYFLLVASNAEPTGTSITKSTVNPTKVCSATSTESHSVSLQAWPQSTGTSWTQRRLTEAITLDENTVAFIGGQGPQNRLPNMDVLCRDEQRLTMKQCMPLPPARVCHTTTSLGSGNAILVGGRASPTQALADCWLIKDGEWSRTNDLGLARYRHCTAPVNVALQGSEDIGALVFGGRASDGTVLDDWLVWTVNSGWRSVSVDGPRPPARFGAAMAAGGTAQNRGLLIGGIGAGGTVVEDAWEWSFSAAPEPRVTFQNLTNDTQCGVSSPTYARIGASLVPWGDSLLLVGGVSKKGIHSWAEDFVLLARNGTGISTEYLPVQMPSKRPLLVGTGVAAVSRDEIVIAGGGAVCFAMGSFWNEDVLSITQNKAGETRAWRPLSVQAGEQAQSKPTNGSQNEKRKPQQKKTKKSTSPRTKNIPRVQVHSKDDFSSLCATAKPVIIEGSVLGPCSDLWTVDYLREKLDSSRKITVEESPSSRVVSKRKDPRIIECTVASFLDSVSNGSHVCLPEVSAPQTKKLEDDFPEIAADFQLASSFEEAKSNKSSTSLQISGALSLPLHYNVLSSLLCQIRGRRTLHVYPPSDVKYLALPPGSSYSNLDVLTSRDPDLRLTHPHVAHLGPGDVLFIPPMWTYTEATEEGINIAVSVSWRSLKIGYAEDQDMYGKQDLQAYEDGRQHIEKMTKAFEGMPEEIRRFYLDRLAGELLEKRGKFGVGKKAV